MSQPVHQTDPAIEVSADVAARLPSASPMQMLLTGLARFGPLVALIVLSVVTAIMRPEFMHPENIINILNQNVVIGIAAMGATFIIISGGIDLSVGSLLALAGVVAIKAMNHFLPETAGASEWPAVLIGLSVAVGVGVLAGMLNGLMITSGRITPFIATLAALVGYRSCANWIADGGQVSSRSLHIFPAIGQGLPIPGTNIAGPRALEPIPLEVPWSVIGIVLLIVLCLILLNRTRFGRYVVAIGANERAAHYSGIAVGRIRFLTYSFMGLLMGLGAIVHAARYNSVSSSQAGNLLELDAIAAVVLGGTRMAGGSGTILGTVIGVLLLGVINNMMSMIGVPPYPQGLVKGLIIVGAVLLQRLDRRNQ